MLIKMKTIDNVVSKVNKGFKIGKANQPHQLDPIKHTVNKIVKK
jgi:hypothetical protein